MKILDNWKKASNDNQGDLIRDGWSYQNGWNFGKFPGGGGIFKPTLAIPAMFYFLLAFIRIFVVCVFGKPRYLKGCQKILIDITLLGAKTYYRIWWDLTRYQSFYAPVYLCVSLFLCWHTFDFLSPSACVSLFSLQIFSALLLQRLVCENGDNLRGGGLKFNTDLRWFGTIDNSIEVLNNNMLMCRCTARNLNWKC